MDGKINKLNECPKQSSSSEFLSPVSAFKGTRNVVKHTMFTIGLHWITSYFFKINL
jgi:hypothetical protein